METCELLEDFADFAPDPPKMRDMCYRCSRPAVVCWCPYLPRKPVELNSSIIIMQHPYEESRRLKTAPMLYHGMEKGKCQIISAKRFPLNRYPGLKDAIDDPQTLLMYPSDSAVDLEEFIKSEKMEGRHPGKTRYNLILLDGTWFQARGIYCRNTYLHSLKQVKLSGTGLSEYVIRTQPNDASLSTLESAVIALSILENRPDIKQPLLEPLRAMCRFQMDHGAVTHHSKQYLIENGLYQKQVSKIQRRKFIEVGGTKLKESPKTVQIKKDEEESCNGRDDLKEKGAINNCSIGEDGTRTDTAGKFFEEEMIS